MSSFECLSIPACRFTRARKCIRRILGGIYSERVTHVVSIKEQRDVAFRYNDMKRGRENVARAKERRAKEIANISFSTDILSDLFLVVH